MTKEAAEFSFSDFDASDTADMTVTVNGKLTNWVWTFAGPGHEKTQAQANRMSRERLHTDRLKEQAVVNGKKWKAPEESPDEVRSKNVEWIVERLLEWSPVVIDGKEYPFSPENARALLSDPRKVGLLTQAIEFLADEASFTKRSA